MDKKLLCQLVQGTVAFEIINDKIAECFYFVRCAVAENIME
jgi:hypothetical protein